MARVLVVARYFLFDNIEGKYSNIPETISWVKDTNQEVLALFDHAELKQKWSHAPDWENWLIQDDIENVGREQGAYLRYIYQNYDSLPEITFFTQADPFYHDHQFIEHMNGMRDEACREVGFYGFCPGGQRNSYISGIKYELKRCFGIDYAPNIINVSGNGIFMATAERIKHYPRSSWKMFYDMVAHQSLSLEIYTAESIWQYLLGDHFADCRCSSV